MLLDLYQQAQCVKVVLTVDNNLVMGLGTEVSTAQLLSVKENVHTADDKHVIGTSQTLPHPCQGPSAFTALVSEACKVTSSVPEKRQPLLVTVVKTSSPFSPSSSGSRVSGSIISGMKWSSFICRPL